MRVRSSAIAGTRISSPYRNFGSMIAFSLTARSGMILVAWQQRSLSEQLNRLQPQIAESDPLGAYAVKLYLQRAGACSRSEKE